MGKERRSIAVWYTSKQDTQTNDASDPPLELHFNLWQCQGTKSSAEGSFLDVGLMLSAAPNIREICLYIPVFCDETKITDISKKLEDRTTAIAVFNETLTINKFGHFNDLFLENGGRFARVFNCAAGDFRVSNKLDQAEIGNGSILRISEGALDRARKDLEDDDKIYMRFRVFLPSGQENPFIGILRPWDWKVLRGFDKIKYVDFRLNEVRNLPVRISRDMENGQFGKFRITQVHFLLAMDVRADFISGHTSFHKCRMLEKALWENYAEPTLQDHGLKLPDDMVIYHWRANPPKRDSSDDRLRSADDFIAFMKFRIHESSAFTVGRYVAWALLIGAGGSYLANLAS